MSQLPYDGRYDNLLWFYTYNFHLIQQEYTIGHNKDKDFKKIANYIQKKKVMVVSSDWEGKEGQLNDIDVQAIVLTEINFEMQFLLDDFTSNKKRVEVDGLVKEIEQI